jgi:hypothetical protein
MVNSMKRQWTQDELAEHWTLLPDELKLLELRSILAAFLRHGR